MLEIVHYIPLPISLFCYTIICFSQQQQRSFEWIILAQLSKPFSHLQFMLVEAGLTHITVHLLGSGIITILSLITLGMYD